MSFRRLIGTAAAAFSTLMLAAPVRAMDNEGAIIGRVRCVEGYPLPYANVVVLGSKLWAVTLENGSFVIAGVPPGAIDVECTYVGFQRSMKPLTVDPGKAKAVDFVLEFDRGLIESPKLRSGRISKETFRCHAPCRVEVNISVIEDCGRNSHPPPDRRPQQVPAPAYRFALEQNHPNPLNPTTEIAFELAHRAPARLRIYDVSGRLIRLLLDGTLDAGPHAIIWDGQNDRGRPVSSGIYFYRLEAAEFAETRQLAVIR